MKQLTALLTAIVMIFSLSATVLAAEGDPEPSVGVGAFTVPDNPAGSELSEIPQNAEMAQNEGTVILNSGKVEINLENAAVETNAGTVEDNRGTVIVNELTGTVTTNDGTIGTNYGLVECNVGVIEINSGDVDLNAGTVIFNDGAVTDAPEAVVLFNTGDVLCGSDPDEVMYNAGIVIQCTPNGDDLDEVVYYGVVYSMDSLPQELAELLPADVSLAEETLYGLVSDGTLVFREAVSESGDPVITLLTEGASFQRDGYSLDSWLDANHDNAAYAPGETVTVTSPLWLIPNWVLISVPASPSRSESGRSSVPIAVPAAAEQTENWKLFYVTVSSSDPRVFPDSELPVAAIHLSADLAEDLRSGTLKVEFDGEILPSGSYSLSFHQDGTVTLLFNQSFLSTLSAGEHEVVLCLQNTDIYVTLLLTDPTPEETSLRARKHQLSGAFTNMPQSSAASEKGKSG